MADENIKISSGAQILDGTPPNISRTAVKKLQSLKVTITLETKILGSAKMPDGRTELTLSNDQKIATDLYLPQSAFCQTLHTYSTIYSTRMVL